MKLDQAFINRLRHPINKVWNYIGYDIEQCCIDNHEKLTNKGVIEVCIDAGRLADHPGEDKEADELVTLAIKEHGYTKVLNFLSKHLKYV